MFETQKRHPFQGAFFVSANQEKTIFCDKPYKKSARFFCRLSSDLYDNLYSFYGEHFYWKLLYRLFWLYDIRYIFSERTAFACSIP